MKRLKAYQYRAKKIEHYTKEKKTLSRLEIQTKLSKGD
jgi:hypothetical protein